MGRLKTLGVWRSTRVYPGFKRGMTEGGNGRNSVWVEISVAETVMQLVGKQSPRQGEKEGFKSMELGIVLLLYRAEFQWRL